MTVIPIKSEYDYKESLRRLEEIFDATVGSPESDKADILGLLIDEYEKKHYRIKPPNPIKAIIIRMEEMNLKQKDLVDTIGVKNRVSEVLSHKRKLTIEMIRKLTARLNISPEVLINDYQLAR